METHRQSGHSDVHVCKGKWRGGRKYPERRDGGSPARLGERQAGGRKGRPLTRGSDTRLPREPKPRPSDVPLPLVNCRDSFMLQVLLFFTAAAPRSGSRSAPQPAGFLLLRPHAGRSIQGLAGAHYRRSVELIDGEERGGAASTGPDWMPPLVCCPSCRLHRRVVHPPFF